MKTCLHDLMRIMLGNANGLLAYMMQFHALDTLDAFRNNGEFMKCLVIFMILVEAFTLSSGARAASGKEQEPGLPATLKCNILTTDYVNKSATISVWMGDGKTSQLTKITVRLDQVCNPDGTMKLGSESVSTKEAVASLESLGGSAHGDALEAVASANTSVDGSTSLGNQ